MGKDEVENEKYQIPQGHLGETLYHSCKAVVDNEYSEKYAKHFKIRSTPHFYQRKLIWVGEGSSAENLEEPLLTIMTYNVMSDKLPKRNNHETKKWASDWYFRRVLLLKQIKSSHADIICLQEVNRIIIF